MAFAVISSMILNLLSVIKLKLMNQKLSTVERNLLFSTITSTIVQCLAAGNTVGKGAKAPEVRQARNIGNMVFFGGGEDKKFEKNIF